ncbi:MAG TPA: hypothetical protein VJJ28_00785 [Candidatus Paceibacterota bacterium]
MLQKIESHIERLREKPDHIKKRIAFLASFSITAIIFIFWLASFGVKSSSVIVEDTLAKSESPISSLSSSLLAGVGDAVKGVRGVFIYAKELFLGANKAEYSASDMIEVIPGKR